VGFVLKRLHAPCYLPVIIEQSTIAGKCEVLWASLAFRGRAWPIAFRFFRHVDISADPEGSQNSLEEAFVRQVVALLPRSAQPLLVFDRGYARAPLSRLLDGLGVQYVVRVKKDVRVQRARDTRGVRGEKHLARDRPPNARPRTARSATQESVTASLRSRAPTGKPTDRRGSTICLAGPLRRGLW